MKIVFCLKYVQGMLNTLSGKFVNKHIFVYFRSSVCSLEHTPIYFFREIDIHFSRDGTWPEEISSLTNDRRIAGTSPLNSAVQNIPGITGLNNLGNTCYMNAALQCVSNTKILAQYFQKNCHLHELNRDNPLGFHGHVAKRYG